MKYYTDISTIPEDRKAHCVLLYSLHLSKSRKAMPGKPTVKSVSAVLCGTYDVLKNDIVQPDANAVREALPAYYRAAFDRAGGKFWFVSKQSLNKLEVAYVTLHDRRYHTLNTLYAIPYYFDTEMDLTPEFIAGQKAIDAIQA